MKFRKALLKGALIFGILGFATFVLLTVMGMVMNALGFECDCYVVFSWSLIGVAVLSGILLWFGCCCRKNDDEEQCNEILKLKKKDKND